jgi:integrase
MAHLERKRRNPRRKDEATKLPAREVKWKFHPDPGQLGLFIRNPPASSKSPAVYAVTARNPHGKQVWKTIGVVGQVSIESARAKAKTYRERITKGLPAEEPEKPKPHSYKGVAEDWLKRYAAKNGLRSRAEAERLLKNFVFPVWGDRAFEEIGRLDVTVLLDGIEDSTGAWNADHVLSTIRQIARWHMTRTDSYVSPFVPRMQRTTKEERTRTRKLGYPQADGKKAPAASRDELQKVWRAAEGAGMFGAFLQICLLTAQRRSKVASMRWKDISDDGVWTIPTEAREKANAEELKLPEMALAIIRAQPRFDGCPYVFAAVRKGKDGKAGPINGFNKRKAQFDRTCGVRDWTVHDLRRTAKSLMTSAGVMSHVSEQVLGHSIKGIEAVYEQHDFFAEKAQALEALAAKITSIVDPPGDNVVPMPKKGRRAS